MQSQNLYMKYTVVSSLKHFFFLEDKILPFLKRHIELNVCLLKQVLIQLNKYVETAYYHIV